MKEIKITIDESVDIEDIERDTYIMLGMDNGEKIFGMFRFTDGDIIALKAKTDDGKGATLGWPIDRVRYWGFVEQC